MNKKREESALQKWLKEVEKSGIKEIKQFAHYLQSDWTAVKHALLYPWSNGLVEGHVNRLKMIKRQMYGRAKFDLLFKKVLSQPE
ncbi:transposase [Peribacillus butanolivorans]|uniref:transposase n=1 Tax=Peribacillus butanolivorans TaxID=421767 RepID=UPI0036948482